MSLHEEDQRPAPLLGHVVDLRARPGAGQRQVEVGRAAVGAHAGAAGEGEDVRVVAARGARGGERCDLDDVLGVVLVVADGEAAVEVHAVVASAFAGARPVAAEEAVAASVEGKRVAVHVERAGGVVERRLELHHVEGDAGDGVAELPVDAGHETARFEVETEAPESAEPLAAADVAAEERRPAVVIRLVAAPFATRSAGGERFASAPSGMLRPFQLRDSCWTEKRSVPLRTAARACADAGGDGGNHLAGHLRLRARLLRRYMLERPRQRAVRKLFQAPGRRRRTPTRCARRPDRARARSAPPPAPRRAPRVTWPR